MKLASFAALFIKLTIAGGHWHVAPRYCELARDTAPAIMRTDWADVSRAQEQYNCDVAMRAVRVRIWSAE